MKHHFWIDWIPLTISIQTSYAAWSYKFAIMVYIYLCGPHCLNLVVASCGPHICNLTFMNLWFWAMTRLHRLNKSSMAPTLRNPLNHKHRFGFPKTTTARLGPSYLATLGRTKLTSAALTASLSLGPGRAMSPRSRRVTWPPRKTMFASTLCQTPQNVR